MYPCKICNSNNWKYKFKKDKKFPNGEITAICKKCNYYVKFPATKKKKEKIVKEQPKEPSFAEYKIENGKRYLRNNDWPNRFREVGLKTGFHKGKKYIQVALIELCQKEFIKENHIQK